jgi:MFS family permease
MRRSALVSNVGVLMIPLAAGGGATVIATLGVAFFLQGLGATGTNVHTYAIRQAVTPDRLLGRTNAVYRMLTWGLIPLGALLGGLLGEALGLRPALWIGAALLFPSWLWLFFSPARSLRTLPASAG